MSGTQAEWPSCLPPGCPPAEAAPTDGDYFYLVANDPPEPDDMKTAAQRNAFVGKDECQRNSLSCWQERVQAEQLRIAVPRLRDYHVGYFALTPDHGVVLQTGRPGHHSLWLRQNFADASHTLLSLG